MSASTDISETLDFIRERWDGAARVGLILGTGLGGFVNRMEIDYQFAFQNLPHFPRVSAIGHRGRLNIGRVDGVPVIALQGRVHAYEGHSLDVITFGVRVLQGLGVRTLIVSCAAGGLQSSMRPGDLMLIEDHLDLQFSSPRTELEPQPEKSLVCQRPARDHASPYDVSLGDAARRQARQLGLRLHTGVYAAVSGPNYETRAEIRWLRTIADAVGMSTVPETNQARALGMRVCGISMITNVCNPDTQQIADGHDVIRVAEHASRGFEELVCQLIRSID